MCRWLMVGFGVQWWVLAKSRYGGHKGGNGIRWAIGTRRGTERGKIGWKSYQPAPGENFYASNPFSCSSLCVVNGCVFALFLVHSIFGSSLKMANPAWRRLVAVKQNYHPIAHPPGPGRLYFPDKPITSRTGAENVRPFRLPILARCHDCNSNCKFCCSQNRMLMADVVARDIKKETK